MDLYAGGDNAEHPEHVRSPRFKSIVSFLKRSSSHSSSITIGSDRQSDIIVGSLDSMQSMRSSTSSAISIVSSQGSSQGSSQSSPSRSGNRLSRALARLSVRRTHAPAAHEQEEGVVVENVHRESRPEDPTEKAEFIFDTMESEDIFEKSGLVLKCISEGVPTIFIEGENDEYMKQLNEIDALIATFDRISDKIQTYQKRAVPDFVSNYVETLEENFKDLKAPGQENQFDPKSIYTFLDIDDPALPNYEVRKRIEAKERENPGHYIFFRQLEYPFRNDFGKQHYDACLQGEDALDKLKIHESNNVPLTFLAHLAIVCKNGLSDYKQKMNIRSASSQSLIKSPDLADHALTLELDVKANVQ